MSTPQLAQYDWFEVQQVVNDREHPLVGQRFQVSACSDRFVYGIDAPYAFALSEVRRVNGEAA